MGKENCGKNRLDVVITTTSKRLFWHPKVGKSPNEDVSYYSSRTKRRQILQSSRAMRFGMSVLTITNRLYRSKPPTTSILAFLHGIRAYSGKSSRTEMDIVRNLRTLFLLFGKITSDWI